MTSLVIRKPAMGASRNRSSAILVAPVLAFCGFAQASEDALERKCRSLLQRSVFNCGCTTEFLEQHFSGEQADILLRLWVLAVNGDKSSRQLTALYIQHGRKTIDGTVMQFHTYRDRLRVYCAQGDSPEYPISRLRNLRWSFPDCRSLTSSRIDRLEAITASDAGVTVAATAARWRFG